MEPAEETGYLHPRYAESFFEFATPLELPRSGGSILEREIPGSALRDAMGPYPIFACRDWTGLAADLDGLADRVVSVTLVTDPFGGFDEPLLRRCFDLVRPYKPQYVTDLSRAVEDSLGRRHRRNLTKARARVELETCPEPVRHLDEWVALWAHLAERHAISGIRAFSQRAFAVQLGVPGLVMFRARVDGEPVGIHLWYVQGDVAYGHLGATSPLGHESMAAYALYGYAIEQLRGRVRWLALGAGPGLEDDEAGSGLREFKRGWSTGTRPAYLCGRILQPESYESLAESGRNGSAGYFPAYRAGELGPVAAGTEPD